MSQTVEAPVVPVPERFHTPATMVDTGDASIAVRRDGTGPTVLYLHGHWATRRWLPFHQALAGTVDLIAPDLPGFGESSRPDWLTGRDDMVLALRGLLDTMGTEPVHLVGYGLGAWLGADFATFCPTYVRSLSVIAPFGLRVPGEPIQDIFMMNPDDIMTTYYSGPADGFEDLVPGVGSPMQGGPEEFAHRYGELGMAGALIWDMRYDLKLEHRLPRLGKPGLVVSAASDRVVPAGHGHKWAELLSAREVIIDGAGHALVVQQPEAVAKAIASFVTEVSI